MQLPLFPLSGIVLPDGLMPLRLFEARYIDMVKQCFRTESGFGVCLIHQGREAGQPADPYPMGTLVRIVDFDRGDDGLLHITVQGEREFDLLACHAEPSGLLLGDVQLIDPGEPTAMTPAIEELSEKLALILKYVDTTGRVGEHRLEDADWVCHRLLELLPLPAPTRYDILALRSNSERLDALAGLRIVLGDASD